MFLYRQMLNDTEKTQVRTNQRYTAGPTSSTPARDVLTTLHEAVEYN